MGGSEFHEAGFAAFVEVRYADLLRTAYLLTGSRHAAEDLLQTCLLSAMRRWKHIADPQAYLRRALVNQRTSFWRRLRGGEVLAGFLPDQAVPDPTDSLAARDELLTALGRLPVRMRTVLVLRYWEDLSEADTAALLGCS